HEVLHEGSCFDYVTNRTTPIHRLSRLRCTPAAPLQGLQRTLFAVAIALCLAACSSHQENGPDQHRLTGNDSFVIVEDAGDRDHPTPLAEQYCAAYGKKAHFTILVKHRHGRYASGVDAQFECVTAS